MCPTRHFVYIFQPSFPTNTAKNYINKFNNHVLIVAPVTFAPAGATTPSAEFLFYMLNILNKILITVEQVVKIVFSNVMINVVRS